MKVVLEWITPSVAISALILGIINSYSSFLKTRVTLRVKPSFSFFFNAGLYTTEDDQSSQTISIEITNLSEFEVAITEVGFKRVGSKLRAVITPPFLTTRGQLNRIDLKPRDNISVLCGPDVFSMIKSSRIRSAHVKTACGVEILGTSRGFKQFCRSQYKTK